MIIMYHIVWCVCCTTNFKAGVGTIFIAQWDIKARVVLGSKHLPSLIAMNADWKKRHWFILSGRQSKWSITSTSGNWPPSQHSERLDMWSSSTVGGHSGTLRSPRARSCLPQRSKVSGYNLTLCHSSLLRGTSNVLRLFSVILHRYAWIEDWWSLHSQALVDPAPLTPMNFMLTHWDLEQNNQLLQCCEEESSHPVNVLHTFFTNSNSYFKLLIVLTFSHWLCLLFCFFGEGWGVGVILLCQHYNSILFWLFSLKYVQSVHWDQCITRVAPWGPDRRK